MKHLALSALALILPLAGCADETLSGYADPKAVYKLTEIDGTAFQAHATITFPEPGRMAGDAPCNLWFGAQEVPYPWFDGSQIGVTKRACFDDATNRAETAFLDALGEMSLAEVQGPVLILSNDDGREMVFRAE
ncbi:MAG: META domain-containing protein [Silicimonas sp.]|nr:META domain-containing protein [Silicimonas sp.]